MRMGFNFKRFLDSILICSSFFVFLSTPTLLTLQPESAVNACVRADINDPNKEEEIFHENCLLRCPAGTLKDNLLVDHDIIVLSSNKKTKFADWVAYKVKIDYIVGPERLRNWAKDPNIDVQFTFIPEDYKDMSKIPYLFDRGHQAPLASFKNHPKWYMLNYLSNITPQKKDLNRGAWEKLESAERNLVKHNEVAYVLTGPYYDAKNIIKGPFVKRINYMVPSGYWKIIAIKQGDKIKTASFMFSQNTPSRDNYCKYLVNIPKIEQSTKLKFFGDNSFLLDGTLKNEIGCGNTSNETGVSTLIG